MDPKIKANEDNNAKYLTGLLSEEEKKKLKKQNGEEPIQESSETEPPLEYFTE